MTIQFNVYTKLKSCQRKSTTGEVHSLLEFHYHKRGKKGGTDGHVESVGHEVNITYRFFSK